jgi:N-acetylmuramic acid 6-phosphate etherase
VVDALLGGDAAAVRSVRRQRAALARAAGVVAEALLRGGRLIYAGAGAAGRLAVTDTVETAGTFGLPASRVLAVLAGGPRALSHAAVGDAADAGDAEARLRAAALGPRDVLCVVAPGLVPFAAGALAYGRHRRSHTLVLATAPVPGDAADVVVVARLGPALLDEAPWLGAATAAKVMLATLSTTAMVLVGKTYGGVVLDPPPVGAAGQARGVAVVERFTGLAAPAAAALLARAGGRPKVAIVMHRRRVSRARAEALIVEHVGRLRAIVGQPGSG